MFAGSPAQRVTLAAEMFDWFIHLRVEAKMPLWARFLISVGGGALTVVSLTLANLETVTVVDNLRAFFGLWLGPVSIFSAIVGLWVQPTGSAFRI